MGGGIPVQISLKAMLQGKIEAGHKEEVRETLGTFIITVDPDDTAGMQHRRSVCIAAGGVILYLCCLSRGVLLCKGIGA